MEACIALHNREESYAERREARPVLGRAGGQCPGPLHLGPGGRAHKPLNEGRGVNRSTDAPH